MFKSDFEAEALHFEPAHFEPYWKTNWGCRIRLG